MRWLVLTLPCCLGHTEVLNDNSTWAKHPRGVAGNIIARGFVPATILKPCIAFSVELIEWYLRLAKFCKTPIQSFCKALCSPVSMFVSLSALRSFCFARSECLFKLEYKDGFRKQFANALEIYVNILSRTEKIVRIVFPICSTFRQTSDTT